MNAKSSQTTSENRRDRDIFQLFYARITVMPPHCFQSSNQVFMQAQQALCHQEHPSSCSSRMEVFSPKKLMTLMLSCITEMMLETTGNMKLMWVHLSLLWPSWAHLIRPKGYVFWRLLTLKMWKHTVSCDCFKSHVELLLHLQPPPHFTTPTPTPSCGDGMEPPPHPIYSYR